ncbi:MAG TPA: hypothetical protein VHH73_06375 [Verrucomicrobiae bacterium]|nr:hypothetical protein [Verrucomicrobiae bacterium]
MKKLPVLAAVALALAGWATTVNGADVATVKEDRVNVRGKAALSGEVVTQLRKDEKTVILEEITIEKPKADEPARWAKILLPTNTPVWVNATFVDPTNKNVLARKLNIRSGPGENFSVLGIAQKGDILKDIRVADGWMEIEAPTNAYGFVAADLLAKGEATSLPAAPVMAETKPVTPPPVTETPVPLPPPVTKVVPQEDTATVAPPISPPPVVAETKPPVAAPVVPQETAKPLVVTLPPQPAPPKADEPPPKRIVTREGIVRRAFSIQAPSEYQLVSAETGESMDYLLTDKIDLKLAGFRGRKVLVTGEELVEKRWPNTPLIRVETLRIAP